MRLRVLLIPLSVALVMLPACGDDDGDSADQDAAEAAVAALTAQLESDGFEESQEDEEDESDDLAWSEECEEMAAAFPEDDQDIEGATADAETPDYTRGEFSLDGGTEELLSAFVGLTEEPDQLDVFFNAFGDERLGGCLQEAFLQGLTEAAAEDNLEITADLQANVTPGEVGDEAIDIRLQGTLAFPGFEMPLELNMNAARVGRSVAMVMATSFGGQPTVDTDGYLQLLLDELQTAATS